MHILHGTWLVEFNSFGLWGEDTEAEPRYRKGRRAKTAPHPTQLALDTWFNYLVRFMTDPQPDGRTVTIWMPGLYKTPQPSLEARRAGATDPGTDTTLLAWDIDCLLLGPIDTLDFFLQLPPDGDDSFQLGSDLRYWQQMALLAMSSLVEGRYVPRMEQTGRVYRAQWATYQNEHQLQQWAAQMPMLCRACADALEQVRAPEDLLTEFLSSMTDAFVRDYYAIHNLPTQAFLRALGGSSARVQLPPREGQRFARDLEAWLSTGAHANGGFRVCFRLSEPRTEDGPWVLDYLLQAVDDPGVLLEAEQVWDAPTSTIDYLERRFEKPQERLLKALGTASTIFAPIERSLRQTYPRRVLLDKQTAFQFLTEAVLQLDEAGFGILVPNWWQQRRQLKAKASIKAPSDEPLGFLTKDSLLKYEWQMSLGDEAISQQEFEALVALKQPLVRYKGEWVALGAEQVDAALEFFESTQDREISLLDALRAEASAEAEADVDFEIDDVEVVGWLNDVFERLRTPDLSNAPELPQDLHATLRPYQERGFGWLAQMRQMGLGACLADDMGLGKAQPLDAKILTPTGWACMGDMRVGDAVVNAQGQTSHITGVYPQGEKDIYRVTFSDGAFVECCDEHLWAVNSAVRNRRGNPYQILPLSEIRNKLWDGAGNARHYIPMTQPVEFEAQHLLLDPYLLGVLLGDGGMSQHWVMLSTADEEIIAAASDALPNGITAKPASQYDYRLSGESSSNAPNPVIEALRDMELMGCRSHEKFIPHRYRYTRFADRVALFQGLMDTDGSVRQDNTLEFCTTSQQLAYDLVELVQSFGGRATLREKQTHYTYKGVRKQGKLAYVLIIALPEPVLPFRLSRKAEVYQSRSKYPPSRAIVDVAYVGRKLAQCISVDSPDQLYITDHYVVTHNTLQTITLWLHEREKLNIDQPALLVCPTSVVGNWRHEIRRFAPSLRVMTHQGVDRHADPAAFKRAAEQVDVVLTSYALMRRDIEMLRGVEWSDVVLDEAQNIKNPNTKQAQAARALPADFKVALTGTPVENRLSELWSILHFLNPGYLGSQKAFRSTFSTPIERYNDEEAALTLRKITAPFILRRVKTDPSIVQDLPDKFENTVHCSLTAEQATLYEAEVREALSAVEAADSEMARRGNVLRMLTRLKQICNHPAHFLKEGPKSRLQGRSGKLIRLTEMLNEVRDNDERLLIFTQYAEMGHLLEAYLQQHLREEILFLHGGTPAKKREQMVETFQSEAGPPVFVLSLKAGGTGLNLTRANHVFHYDRWYNPAVENQATDRAFRIGQTKDVQVHKYICLGTLEERIDEMIAHKQALADAVVGAGESWISELNDDELRELVSLRDEVAEA